MAKLAGKVVVEDTAELLSPNQLGFGIRGGAGASVHATRKFIQDLLAGLAVVNLDFVKLSLFFTGIEC